MLRRLALTVAALLALAPAAAAEDWTLIGRWTFTEAKAAPWTPESHRAQALALAKDILEKEITFGSKTVAVKHQTLACTDARYETSSFPPDFLFQGGLPGPDHASQAKALGLRTDLIPGIQLACSTGLFSYHFVDRDTALLGFNNAIYTLKRKSRGS